MPSFARTLGRKKKEVDEDEEEESEEEEEEFVVGGSSDLAPERWKRKSKPKKTKTLLKHLSVASGLSALSSATDDKEKDKEKKEEDKDKDERKRARPKRKNFGLTLGRKRKTEPEPSGGGLMMSEFFTNTGDEDKDGEFNFCFNRTASFQDYEGFEEEEEGEGEFQVSDESSQSIQTEILYQDGTLKHEYESSAATEQPKQKITRPKKYNQETLSSSVSTAKEQSTNEDHLGEPLKQREKTISSSGAAAGKEQTEKTLPSEDVFRKLQNQGREEAAVNEDDEDEEKDDEEDVYMDELGPGAGRTTFKQNSRPAGTTPAPLKRLFETEKRDGDDEDMPLQRPTFKQSGQAGEPKEELSRLFESTTEGHRRVGASGSVLLKGKLRRSGGGDAEDEESAELRRLFESTNEGKKQEAQREHTSFTTRPISSEQLEKHVPRKGRRKSKSKRENMNNIFGSIVTKKSDGNETESKEETESEGLRDTGSTSKGRATENRPVGSVTFTNEVNFNRARDSKAKPIVKLKHQKSEQSASTRASARTTSTLGEEESRGVQSLILKPQLRDTKGEIERDLKAARQEGSSKSKRHQLRDKEQKRVSQTFQRKDEIPKQGDNEHLERLFNSTVQPKKSRGPVGTGHVAEGYKSSGVRLHEQKEKDKKVNPTDLYDDQGVLGEGSFGLVRRVRDKKSGQILAAKICQIDTFESVMENLKYEVELLSGFRSCPYIVRFVQFLVSFKKELWIVTEVCEGGDVFTLMEKIMKTGLKEQQVAAIMASNLLALETLHIKNIIHRDVKGANILLSMDGLAKLSDLGVSKRTTRAIDNSDRRALKNGTKVGSLYWMAPELAKQEPYNFQVDIWSLGITCIECAQGYPPLGNLNEEEASNKIKTQTSQGLSCPEDYSKEMNNFIARCLTYDPYLRPTAKNLYSDPFVKQQIADLQLLTKQGYFDMEKGQQRIMKRLAHIESNPEQKDAIDQAFERTVLQIRGLITDNMDGLKEYRSRHKGKIRRWAQKLRKQSNY